METQKIEKEDDDLNFFKKPGYAAYKAFNKQMLIREKIKLSLIGFSFLAVMVTFSLNSIKNDENLKKTHEQKIAIEQLKNQRELDALKLKEATAIAAVKSTEVIPENIESKIETKNTPEKILSNIDKNAISDKEAAKIASTLKGLQSIGEQLKQTQMEIQISQENIKNSGGVKIPK